MQIIPMTFFNSPSNGPSYHSDLHLSNGRSQYEIVYHNEYESRLMITDPITLETISYEFQALWLDPNKNSDLICLSSPNCITLENNQLIIYDK